MHSTKYGGLEKFLVCLAKELHSTGICLVVIYNSKPRSCEFIEDFSNAGGKIIISHALHLIKYFIDFIWLTIKFKPILIHIHFQTRYSILFAKLLGSKKVFVTLHLMLTDKNYNYIDSVRQIPLRTRINIFLINKFSDRILTVSDAAKSQYISLYQRIRSKTERFYLGTYPSDHQNLIKRSEYKLLPDKVIIGTISFNSPIKGLDILMDAVVTLKNKMNCDSLLVAQLGIDPNASENSMLITQSEQKGINENIMWLGIRNDVQKILPNLDIYCQPSRSESLPLAIIEAGMAGLPIVASNVGGIPELVQDGYNGFLVEPGNHEHLAECLFRLISDYGLRKKMGDNSRRLMTDNFNIHKQAKLMSEKYLLHVNTKVSK